MTWQPDTFTREERRAAAKAIVRAQVSVDRLDRSEFGSENTELVKVVYRRIDDLLSMIHEDIYGYDAKGNPAQLPSAN